MDTEEFTEEHSIFLNLCPNPIRFEPVSKVTNVFYDDSNQQVFAVRSGGATGVVVKGPKERLNCTFRMEDKGAVLSIKFSPDQKILAVQRTSHSVEFMNFTSGSENLLEYSQTTKNKNASILGFTFVCPNEILFITKLGLELFQIFPEKRMLKFMKSVSVSVDWFLHSPENNILVISTTGGVLQPFQIKPGNIYKFPKLGIDIASLPRNSNGRQGVSERDVTIVSLYNSTTVLILRHKPKVSTASGAEVDVYILNKDNTTYKSHVLKLDTSGRFAINVIDNLIIIHHQASKTSMLFDIRLSGGSDGYATYHLPVVVAMPIRPFKLTLPVVPVLPTGEKPEVECELYSVNWVVFQPNIIIDAKLGCLWTLELLLDPIKHLMSDKIRLVEFFLQRQNGKKHLLKLLQETVLAPDSKNYLLVAGVFDKLNENYRSFLNVEFQNQLALPASGKLEVISPPKGIILVDQQDLYTNIFSNLPNCDKVTDQYIVFVLTEYIRSLTEFQIPVQHYIYELIINAMVRQKNFYQLHQFLMCHVVTDSKPLACLLLSLEGVYPPAHQLALDMLRRISTANDLIVEILLNKLKVIPALRFVQSYGKGDYAQARKFLDVAMKTGNKVVFYSVYKFFEERNIRLRGTAAFEASEMCDIYVDHFRTLFVTPPVFNGVASESNTMRSS